MNKVWLQIRTKFSAYIITNRFTVNYSELYLGKKKNLLYSVWFLMHISPECVFLDGCVCVCELSNAHTTLPLNFTEWPLDLSTEGQSDPQFSVL